MSERFTILIVDDIPANISVLLDALAERHRLLVAESAESCLEQLPHATPDLILLDVLMPGRSGFELLEELRSREACAAIPVIFMTAVDDPEQKHRALTMGAVDYVTKPIYVPEVLARVETHLRLLALQRNLQAQNEALELEIAIRREIEEQLRESLDRAILAVKGPAAELVFHTALARHLLARYFPESGGDRLAPAFLSAWQKRRTPGAALSWRHTLPHYTSVLVVRAFTDNSGDELAFFQLEEEGGRNPAPLRQLGLSPRECEVLFWISEGKSYPEIATILAASPRTIHKHAENLFRKLNVDSRSNAMRLALEVLGN